jgi:hypothetical protein
VGCRGGEFCSSGVTHVPRGPPPLFGSLCAAAPQLRLGGWSLPLWTAQNTTSACRGHVPCEREGVSLADCLGAAGAAG